MVARLEKWDMVLVWCPRCDLEAKRDTGEVVRVGFIENRTCFTSVWSVLLPRDMNQLLVETVQLFLSRDQIR